MKGFSFLALEFERENEKENIKCDKRGNVGTKIKLILKKEKKWTAKVNTLSAAACKP